MAATLDELKAILAKFEGCALKGSATQLVFADGNPNAKLMLVGEAPGRDDDIEGLPFVGRSGKLLNLMLAAIGFDRGVVIAMNPQTGEILAMVSWPTYDNQRFARSIDHEAHLV